MWDLHCVFKLTWLPQECSFFSLWKKGFSNTTQSYSSHGMACCTRLSYTANSLREIINFCRGLGFFFRTSRKKDVHVLVHSIIPHCRRKTQTVGSTYAGFKVRCQTSFSCFRRNPTTTWYVEGITRQGLQELQSHYSPCDAESSDGNKWARMRQQDPLIQHFNCLPFSSFLRVSHLCSLLSVHQKSHGGIGSFISHAFLVIRQWSFTKSVYLKGLAWRRNRWKQSLLLLN